MAAHGRERWDWSANLIPASVLILIWELIARSKQQPQLYPTIEHILKVSLPGFGIFSQSSEPGFWAALGVLSYHGLITVLRISVGLGIGIPVGIAGGLLIHYLRGSGPVSSITLTVVRSIPLLALIPLFKYWFGLSEWGTISYIAIGTFFVIASDSYEAAANISPVYAQQAKLLGAGDYFTLRTVYLPGIQTQLAGGLRNVIGLSWAFSLGAEYVSAEKGLGYITYQCYSYAEMGQLTILAMVYAGLGYGSYEFARFLILWLMPWPQRAQEEFT